jgi:hypothetical protein
MSGDSEGGRLKGLSDEETEELAAVLGEALARAVEGECRLEEPYARVRPILTKGGLRFVCTHMPEHSSEVLAGLMSP